ncbi:folylpolyglutamate synthase, mitochondrial-like isoform X2 [Dysidea avara]|uniref:folylpolyglutamate synthase, mitochondrial-like isoform X2 n=1 Tax=Dysidea avara TaxID=196820 RepID=UPI0033200686
MMFTSASTLLQPVLPSVCSFRCLRRVVSTTYQDAVHSLNQMQTPSNVLKKIAESGGRDYALQFNKSVQYTQLADLQEEDLNSLNVLHISGTKGKGSTGALCESVLRHCGLKTGFFSSPHLMEVRERIRINGNPLSKDKFATYFYHCFGVLDAKKDLMDGELPGYFRFLTIMAYYTFLEEKVDVAIMEVGLGGEYDPTNVIRWPVVCGVTSLDYDHVEQLGQTLGEIAWHKAGIFKPGRPAYTVLQEQEAMQVICKRACLNRVCSVSTVPQWDQYHTMEIDIPGSHQKANTSLALQLCRRWLIEMGQWSCDEQLVTNSNTKPSNGISLFTNMPAAFKNGVERCKWPGRQQVIHRDHVTYYLDGAHTSKSAAACSDWFKSVASEETANLKVMKMLLFNMTGSRDVKMIMNNLKDCGFDHAIFCPNIINTDPASNTQQDTTNRTITTKQQLERCHYNQQCWKTIHPTSQTISLRSVSDAVNQINEMTIEGTNHVQVLVCGSLHLVGAVMTSLDITNDHIYS